MDRGDISRGDKDDYPRFVTTVLPCTFTVDEGITTADQDVWHPSTVVPLPFARMRGSFCVVALKKIEVTYYYKGLGAGDVPGTQDSEFIHFACHHIPRTDTDEAMSSHDAFAVRSDYWQRCTSVGMEHFLTMSYVVDFPGEGYLVPDDHYLFTTRWSLISNWTDDVGYYPVCVVKSWFKRTQISVMLQERLSGPWMHA